MQLVKRAKQGYLPTLDGWRAIAILAVLLDHAVGYQFGTRHPLLFSLTRVGQNGVSLFFAISGFLICSRLLEEEQLTGTISLRAFYVRRAARILPPAMTYLAAIALLGMLGVVAVSQWDWWASVLFFRNYLPPSIIHRGWGGYTIHFWSLAVEEHFYLLWPALLVLSGRRRAKWTAAGLACVFPVWRWWDFRHGFVESLLPGLLVGTRTDVRFDGLLMGCLAALILADPKWGGVYNRYLNLRTWSVCIVLYAVLQSIYRHHYYTIWESILLGLIVSGTVVHPETWVSRSLEWGWLRWIGRLSYSLYLWQQLFLVSGAKYPFSLLQRFPLNLLLLFAIAAFSYRMIERPWIRFGHKLAPPPTPGREDAFRTPPSSPVPIAEDSGAKGLAV